MPTHTYSLHATTLLAFLFLVLFGNDRIRAEENSADRGASDGGGSTLQVEPFKVSVLELSVHGGGKVQVKVYWKVSKENEDFEVRLYNVTPPFAYQWIVPPVEATGFIIVPMTVEPPKAPVEWIPIEVVEPSDGTKENLHKYSLYFPIPLTAGNPPDLMDGKHYLKIKQSDDPALVPERRPGRPQETTGWAFMGIWNSQTSKWNSLYWLEADNAASLRLRKAPTRLLPSGLQHQTLVANFPMRMRKNASAASEEVEPGVMLRPGTVVRVDEIAVEGGASDFRVWARVTTTGQQLKVNK